MNHWARKNTGITNTKGQMIPLFSNLTRWRTTRLISGLCWHVTETSPKALTKLSSFQTGKVTSLYYDLFVFIILQLELRGTEV